MSSFYIPGGPSFGGYPQPPDVPSRPDWQGLARVRLVRGRTQGR